MEPPLLDQTVSLRFASVDYLHAGADKEGLWLFLIQPSPIASRGLLPETQGSEAQVAFVQKLLSRCSIVFPFCEFSDSLFEPFD